MALDAVTFDVDGTLVDSNGLHVEAWLRVLERHGYRVARDRVFEEIGKGGDNLVPDLLGREADETHGKALRAAEPEEFNALARARGIRPFPQVEPLLRTLRERGLKTAIATSGKAKGLEAIERASGVVFSELVDAVVTADDAESSKPAPDLVSAAAAKLKLSPAQGAMVGDTPWDAQSCLRAGVVCIAVRAGGHDDATLLSAGARMTYADAADLLAHLDDALRRASPHALHLTRSTTESLMRHALAAARDGAAHGEAPIGAALLNGAGDLIAVGYNELNRTRNKTAHAEMVTFARAAGKVPTDAKDLILISTLEPCVMCTGAAMEAAVDTIVYALHAPPDAGTTRVRPPQSPESQMPRVVGNVLADESKQLFEDWLKDHRGTQQAQYVQALLASLKRP